jgi:hypothetical protein
MGHIVEPAEKWGEQRHAALAYLAEVLDEGYPASPDKSDPWRIRAEKALVRRANGPWPMTAEEAADYLEEQVAERFPGMSEWQVDSREVHGVRGLRILWGWGPSWLPVRAWADNFAAVRMEGLYIPVEAAGAQPLTDYIYCVKQKGADKVRWTDWRSPEGVDYD